ncbi:hypothetical protein NPIL_534521 [Nephila pilipes]|uniref:Uncharacterized protein n=1 Tax=Nephila pilipes TaxID=299642 RepID=A0A8X6NA18_NEPPI|nr:hypothetical protein NPIL_534521 [Nephila pilipes]
MWPNGNIEGELGLITYLFKRAPFRVNAIPFLLSAIIKEHIEQFHPERIIATSLLDFCLYVDNLIADEDSVQDALKLSRNARQIKQKARMVLKKWITNEVT